MCLERAKRCRDRAVRVNDVSCKKAPQCYQSTVKAMHHRIVNKWCAGHSDFVHPGLVHQWARCPHPQPVKSLLLPQHFCLLIYCNRCVLLVAAKQLYAFCPQQQRSRWGTAALIHIGLCAHSLLVQNRTAPKAIITVRHFHSVFYNISCSMHPIHAVCKHILSRGCPKCALNIDISHIVTRRYLKGWSACWA